MQVGRTGCVPAYGGNGNSRNVSCSKPSLHCCKRPWEGALYKWLTRSASDAMHMALYKWNTFTFFTMAINVQTVEFVPNEPVSWFITVYLKALIYSCLCRSGIMFSIFLLTFLIFNLISMNYQSNRITLIINIYEIMRHRKLTLRKTKLQTCPNDKMLKFAT